MYSRSSPPEDGIFPESANTRETGGLFIAWLVEIFPGISGRSDLLSQVSLLPPMNNSIISTTSSPSLITLSLRTALDTVIGPTQGEDLDGGVEILDQEEETSDDDYQSASLASGKL